MGKIGPHIEPAMEDWLLHSGWLDQWYAHFSAGWTRADGRGRGRTCPSSSCMRAVPLEWWLAPRMDVHKTPVLYAVRRQAREHGLHAATAPWWPVVAMEEPAREPRPATHRAAPALDTRSSVASGFSPRVMAATCIGWPPVYTTWTTATTLRVPFAGRYWGGDDLRRSASTVAPCSGAVGDGELFVTHHWCMKWLGTTRHPRINRILQLLLRYQVYFKQCFPVIDVTLSSVPPARPSCRREGRQPSRHVRPVLVLGFQLGLPHVSEWREVSRWLAASTNFLPRWSAAQPAKWACPPASCPSPWSRAIVQESPSSLESNRNPLSALLLCRARPGSNSTPMTSPLRRLTTAPCRRPLARRRTSRPWPWPSPRRLHSWCPSRSKLRMCASIQVNTLLSFLMSW